jgi:Arylsulfotransferase (ASST)
MLKLLGGAGAGLLASDLVAKGAGIAASTAATAGTTTTGTTTGTTTTTGSSTTSSTTTTGTTTTPGSTEFASRSNVVVRGGVQHFRSRPDLRPPEIVVNHQRAGVAPGFIFTDSHGGPGQQGPMMIDGTGQLVWFEPLSDGGDRLRAFNVQVQQYRGEPVVCWFRGSSFFAHGEGHYELYDQRYRLVARVYGGNGYTGDLHEFLITEAGTALFTCYQKAVGKVRVGRHSRRVTYWCGVVQEVDIASGKVLFQWRSDDHIALEASYEPVPRAAGTAWDYFHVNSIGVDPTDGNLIVSGRNTWSVYKLDRQSGAVIWTLGGKDSDFQMGPNTHFAFQHHAMPRGHGVMTIFDNELGPPAEASQSRGLILDVNERTRNATIVRQYVHHPPLLSVALGSVQPLPDDHVFVGWGQSSQITEYMPNGRVLFDAHLAPGTSSYRAFKLPWTGRPTKRPDLAVTRSHGSATLYASWNGATEVAQWSVHGGASRGSLQPIGVAERYGFETEIKVPHAPRWLTVSALDQTGRVLATAKPQT